MATAHVERKQTDSIRFEVAHRAIASLTPLALAGRKVRTPQDRAPRDKRGYLERKLGITESVTENIPSRSILRTDRGKGEKAR
jgi:hypothetical protein